MEERERERQRKRESERVQTTASKTILTWATVIIYETDMTAKANFPSHGSDLSGGRFPPLFLCFSVLSVSLSLPLPLSLSLSLSLSLLTLHRRQTSHTTVIFHHPYGWLERTHFHMSLVSISHSISKPFVYLSLDLTPVHSVREGCNIIHSQGIYFRCFYLLLYFTSPTSHLSPAVFPGNHPPCHPFFRRCHPSRAFFRRYHMFLSPF